MTITQSYPTTDKLDLKCLFHIKCFDLQACTEMVMPFCFDNVKDMFEKSEWNYTQFARDCHKKWNTMPRPDMADLMYGERKLQGASNIVFTNGLLDPWSSGGYSSFAAVLQISQSLSIYNIQ